MCSYASNLNGIGICILTGGHLIITCCRIDTNVEAIADDYT